MISSTTHPSQPVLGLLFVATLAAISYSIMTLPWLAATGISSLVIAILLGMLFGNALPYPGSWSPGIQFAAKRLLRTAIMLYGFRISFQQIASVGLEALLLDIFVVTFTLSAGYLLGRKVFKLDPDLSLLISAGAAICGAAAVLAVEDILKSDSYKAAVAVGTVVLFGTASMFLYPLLQHAGLFGFSNNQFGIFAGASIHEVAQALVAGANISAEAGKIAVIVKMIRVLLLVPALILLSLLLSRTSRQAENNSKTRLTIPWFAIGFVLVIAFNSLNLLSAQLINVINQIDIILLTMAMGAIGIETKWNKIKKVGLKPLYLATMLFIWLLASVFVIVKWT
ncbi:YeiH family protein [Aquicella lusitana]|uniref:Putative integral membrane protein (TIGR00698 family) n=1 Tax=Aquicella lusitana TaxID=254246 RepID=A0A370GFH6_9COXI|nr:YeiH family protein [Aquicella lusitana]RDI42565.1 putative integral membrane protein (TIGR00698 family) [Aquicella lusitana]VVC74344.1 hypothetical protein AQULUS_21090 [Aquicella lusitana]